MKRIKIYQENSELIEIMDKDDSDINDYTIEISKLLEISNVTILETSEGSVVIRPSKIISISIDEINDLNVKEEKKEIIEDIITDEE